jgi:hypothetical protein
MSLRRVVNGVLLLCVFAWVAVSAMASEYHGQVTFSGLPLPGSTVTVTATQGDKKAVAISDDQGVFAFPDLADGTWTLTIEMTGFTPLKQEVTIAPTAAPATFELKLLSLEQIRAEDKPLTVDTTQLAIAPAAPASGGVAAGATPAAPNAAAPAGKGLLINGSVSNAATSQYSMNAAFGNNRNRRSLYNGSVYLQLENGALDATPYSLSGTPAPKPQFNNYTTGFNFGGPLNIPHLMPRGPYFQINYSHTQNSSYTTETARLPVGLDGSGNWDLSASEIYVPSNLAAVAPACNGYLLATPTATTIDTATGKQVFAGNVIPAQCVSNVSKNLLTSFYTQTPNVAGNSGYNYQIPQNTATQSDSFSILMQKSIGKNNFNGRWSLNNSRGANTNANIFGFLDSSANLGMNTSLSWSRSFTQRLRSQLTYTFSRSRSQSVPNFANKQNVEQMAGISGASNVSQYFGPPTLNFSSGIQGLSDGVFAYNRNETNGIAEKMTWNHMRHNVDFGGGFNRLEFNYLTQADPNGRLSFTGAATQAAVGTGTAATINGGSDLADFLLGIPDTSQIAYGNADKYLRQNTYNIFVNDNYNVNTELTINAGVRWEYGSPVSELKGRLVNLDVGQNYTTATPVTGKNPLLQPDYSRPEPQVGIAWRPISGSSLLIRSGYGVRNDTSVYQAAAYAMAQQAPLSTSLSIANGPSCAFNIASPFGANGCSSTTADTFAIDPNFRVGYVQEWTLGLQRDLPFSMQMVATYDGIKGTRGVQEFQPNTCPPTLSACNTYPHGYTYRTSNGNLTREAGTIQVRRRPRNGFEAGVTYTFAKSLDDDYSLSGQGGVSNTPGIAQDWTNLRGQRGLSNGDQRHLLQVTAQYTTGLGIGGKSLLTGWRGAIYKDWSIHTDFSIGSGLPETPIYAGATAGGSGTTGTIRPDAVGSPSAQLTPGYFLNPNAYAVPSAGFGNARRNSIEGPDTFSLNANMLRTFRLHSHYSLDAQLTASNVLNHEVYTSWDTDWVAPGTATPGTTTIPSLFGKPVGTNSPRSVSVSLRMNF